MTLPTRRLRTCVENWPEAETGAYDPRCCRFSKSCSATVYDEGRVADGDLEPVVVRPTFDVAAEPGLFNKFRVERLDGRDQSGGDKADAKYFVLDYVHDIYAQHAVLAYADACAGDLPELATDLRAQIAITPWPERPYSSPTSN